jgi:hypothetical protein
LYIRTDHKDEVAEIRNELTKELADIYSDAPDTSSKAYKKARLALHISEEMNFSNREIDEFLPERLKGEGA